MCARIKIEGALRLNLATPYMLSTFSQTFFMRMPNGKPELCDSWSRLGKLGSGGYHYRASCACTLSLRSRSENSGPRVSKNDSNNHIPCGGSSKPLSIFISHNTNHTTSSYHTRFIRSSDSSTGWMRVYKPSMPKHRRYKGSSNVHKRNLVMLGALDQGI
jgi:hypothetical protein